jgi:hypothetical protein
VDLHGLHVDEALMYVEASIQREIKKPTTNGKYIWLCLYVNVGYVESRFCNPMPSLNLSKHHNHQELRST